MLEHHHRDSKGNDGEPPADGVDGSDEASDDEAPPVKVEVNQFAHGSWQKHCESWRERRRRQEPSDPGYSGLARELGSGLV